MIDAVRFAELLCDWCLEPQPGQQVLIVSSTLAEPLVRATHRAVLERGAWPVVRVSFPETPRDFFSCVRDEQLDHFPQLELLESQAAEVSLRIDAPGDPDGLKDVDPERIVRAQRAREPVREARSARRWCVTEWPTDVLAARAQISLDEYASLLNGMLFLDREDPVAAWKELSERQAELVERLAGASEVRIQAEGTDLRLRVGGRTWINSDGRRNMPSGEVFTGPVEDSAQGTIRFTIPSRSRGVAVEGVELTFERGVVVAARAQEGEPYLQAALATDDGSRRLGELGIGTNPGIDRATGSTLLDEKIAGTVHLALGRSYPETGASNRSALHWDLVCDLRDGGVLTVDGEPLEVFPDR